MIRLWLTAALLGGAALHLSGLAREPVTPPARQVIGDDEKTGGETTVFADGRNAFSFPAANLSDDERRRFVIGNSFFRRNWVEAPASTQARDGLGPHFIARSCGGCHVQDGRGAPPDLRFRGGDPAVALLLRLSVAGAAEPRLGVRPEPVYGDQFANAAVAGVRPEGTVTIRYEAVPGRFADGTRFVLRKPVYGVADLRYGSMAAGTMLGPRIAPQLIGAGLIERITEADVLGNASTQAACGGPVRGEPNRVFDAYGGAGQLGRFGWKANVATIAHQAASAFNGDIGITSRAFPNEACTERQPDCRRAPRGGRAPGLPEIDDETFAAVVFYTSTLAPPARRGVGDPVVERGRRLFAAADCAACHRPSYVTGKAPLPAFSSPALEGQTIWPYTDLLLHDMGEGLADGRPDFRAGGRQWKTPPLWGIGLIRDVNGHTRLLHDGRADGVLEAILWHGGEAEASRRQVLRMTRAERRALVRFVASL